MRDSFVAAFLGSLFALATYQLVMQTWSRLRHRIQFTLALRRAEKLGIKRRQGHLFLEGRCLMCNLPEQHADKNPAPPGHP